MSDLARRVREHRLTYLDSTRLATLERCLGEVDAGDVRGDVLEAGVALGGSGIVLASGLRGERRFIGHDLFGTIPAPGPRDDAASRRRFRTIAAGLSQGLGEDRYYGYVPDLRDRVTASFAAFGVPVDGDRVQLRAGPFDEALHPDGPIALAHVDADWHDSVRTCLERIVPHLGPGGLLVLDDYADYGGCRRATDEFLRSHPRVLEVASFDRTLVLRRCDEPCGGGDDEREPRFAVVVPVYQQPQYLADAVTSALRQHPAGGTHVVIVDDGCPFPSTGRIGLALADAHPGTVTYLRQSNRGLSAARNAGIRHVLTRFPSVRALFCLDADNRLAAPTLASLWQRLEAEGADWASPSLELFGTETAIWDWAGSFSVYRQLFENQGDAGSLVRREVFERHLFDEDMRRGYEDWEFLLRVARHGCRRANGGRAGFGYRRRGASMLGASRAEHVGVHAEVLRLHADLLAPRRLTRLELEEAPRFAVLNLDDGRARALSTPPVGRIETGEITDLLHALAQTGAGMAREAAHLPPLVLMTTTAAFAGLEAAAVMPGLLLRLQRAIRTQPIVALTVDQDHDHPTLEVLEGETAQGEPALLALSSTTLLALLGLPDPAAALDGPLPGVTLRTSGELGLVPAAGLLEHARRTLVAPPPQPVEDDPFGQGSSTAFSYLKHVEAFDTTLPWAPPPGDDRIDVFFVAPWLRLGGVDQCLLRLVAALPSRLRAHLVLTSAGVIGTSAANLGPFATITTVDDADPLAAGRLLITVLRSADVVVNTHSQLCYDVLAQVARETSATLMGWLHVVDETEHGLPTGFPLQAVRHHEQDLDRFLAVSERLSRTLVNLGAPPEKVLLLENAPVVAPPSLDTALALASRKAARAVDAREPVRILFAGRFDRQKGADRLAAVAAQLRRAEVPFTLTVVGAGVLDEKAVALPHEHTTVLPPVFDHDALRRLYEEHDLVVVPSRFEGLPLAVLDAMSFGCVVVGTRVGAMDEVIEDGANGFLLDPALAEDDLARAVARAIGDAARAEDGLLALRERACRAALARSWERTAAVFAAAVEASRPGTAP